MSGNLPDTITDWLEQELAKKLAKQPDDYHRYRLLSQQWNVWAERRRQFAESNGNVNFSHPHYGHMQFCDYLIVLCMIDGAKSKLERVPA